MGRIIIIFSSLIVAAIFTLNAFWLQLNGHSTLEIINRLPVLMTPSSYVFYIWFFVFIVLFGWGIRNWKNREFKNKLTSIQTAMFSLAMIFQIASLFSWHKELFVMSLVFITLQLLSLFALYLTYPLNEESLMSRYPIAIYFSWSVFLFIFNICYILVYIEWQGFGLSNALWAVIVMTIGTAIALHLRFHHYDIAFPIVFIWCYIGIAISNGFEELLVSTAALFLSGVMVVGILFIRKTQLDQK